MSGPVAILEAGPVGSLSPLTEASPVGECVMATGQTAASSTTWPSANLAMYMPVLVKFPIVVYGLGWLNGTVATGNVDAGIYDAELARLVSLGSTAQAGTSAMQSASITPLALNPGRYYLALAASSASATFTRAQSDKNVLRTCGCAQQATAIPLPSTATFAGFGFSFLPAVYAFTEGTTF